MEPIKKFVLPDRTGGRPDAHIVLSELLISANERQFIIDASNVVRTTPSYLDQVVKHVLQDCNVAQVVFLKISTQSMNFMFAILYREGKSIQYEFVSGTINASRVSLS